VTKKEQNKVYYKANKERLQAKNRARTPSYKKNAELKFRFGITLEEYDIICQKQNYSCAVCLKTETAIDPRTKKPRRLAVDHCHTTNKIRGLLCHKCNRAIGMFKDDYSSIERAALYIKENNNVK
jgi:hypothetical protein